MATLPPTSLFVRLDSRLRQGLQQQIYASIRRAILDGVVAPGARLPSSRALAVDLGVSRTTTLLAVQQLAGRRLSHRAPRLRHLRGRRAARRSPAAARRRAAIEGQTPARCRAAGRRWSPRPDGAQRLGGPPRAVPHRHARPWISSPCALWSRLVNRRLRSVTPAAARLRRPGGLPRRCARRSPPTCRRRAGTAATPSRCSSWPARSRAFELVCRLLLDPGDRAWMEEPGYPGARSALRARRARASCRCRWTPTASTSSAGARRAADARLVYVTPSHQYPLGVPMSLPRRLALLSWARARARMDARGRLRQRVPLRRAAHPVPARARRRRPRHLRRQLQQDAVPGAAPGLPDRAARPAGAASWPRAPRADQHPPTLDQAVLADFIVERPLRAPPAAHARSCTGSAWRRSTRRRSDAARGVLRVRPSAPACTRSPTSRASTPSAWWRRRRARRGGDAAAAYSRVRTAALNALVLGFGAVRPEASRRGMERLAAAIEAARRR